MESVDIIVLVLILLVTIATAVGVVLVLKNEKDKNSTEVIVEREINRPEIIINESRHGRHHGHHGRHHGRYPTDIYNVNNEFNNYRNDS